MKVPAALFVLLALVPSLAAADEPAPLDSVDAVVRGVLDQHPEVEALDAQVAAMDALVEAARARPDPVVGLEYSNMPLSTPWPGEHPMSGVQLKVSQTLLASGKVDARVAEARQRARAGRSAVASLQNRLGGGVAEVWYRLGLARQLRTVTKAHVALLDQLIEVVRVNYEVGRASQHELLQLQTVREQLADDLHDLDRDEQAHVSRLNAALRRPFDAPVETPPKTEAVAPDTRDALVKAVDRNPMFAEIAEAAAVEQSFADRAKSEESPDVTASVGYRVRRGVEMGDEGEDFVSVGVSMPLPWFWNDERWGSQAAASRARARALDARARAEHDRLRGELDGHLTSFARAAQKAKTYEGELVDTARRALDSTLSAYRVGRANFGELFQAERTLLNLERTAIMARTEAALASARLKTLTGAWVPSPKEPQ